ncbi:hypothetical protein DMENIID0001_028480 [Sergentomyia squamirostris]
MSGQRESLDITDIRKTLPDVREFVENKLKKDVKSAELMDVTQKTLVFVEMLQNAVELSTWSDVLNESLKDILSILCNIFCFMQDLQTSIMNECLKMLENLKRKSSNLYMFLLDKITVLFQEFSSSQGDFLTEILEELFIIGEMISLSCYPDLLAKTWKCIHKIITKNSEELKKLSKTVQGALKFLETPVEFFCKQIRISVQNALPQKSSAVLDNILQFPNFYVKILTKFADLFPGDLLSHPDIILECLIFLQAKKFLDNSQTMQIINSLIIDPYMKMVPNLLENQQFIECVINTTRTGDPEIYALLLIYQEILRMVNRIDYVERILERIFLIIPNCHSLFCNHPVIFKDFSRNVSISIIQHNQNESLRKSLKKFIMATLRSPGIFASLFMLHIWQNLQISSRENVRFESLCFWKNVLEKLPQGSFTIQQRLIEEILKTSYDSLPPESQQRVIILNNPKENYVLWSVLGLGRIQSDEKRKYLSQELSLRLDKLIDDFLCKNILLKAFEDMILIMRILAKSTDPLKESLVQKCLKLWTFVDQHFNSSVKIITRIILPLLEMFRNHHKSFKAENYIEIIGIMRKVASGGSIWPIELHIEIINSLQIVVQKDEQCYWSILKKFEDAQQPLNLLSSIVQTLVGIPEPKNIKKFHQNNNQAPPSKKFKQSVIPQTEHRLRKILKDVEQFRELDAPGQSLTGESALIAREIINVLKKAIDH